MPAIGDIFQYTFRQSLDGQVMETVLHFRERAFGVTEANLKLTAQNYWNTMQPLQCTTVAYLDCLIKRMTPVELDPIVQIPTGVVSGSQATAAHNTTIAIVITKRTGTAGKSHRGRLYIGGTPSSWGIDRPTTAPGPATLGTFAGSMLAIFGEGGTDVNMSLGVYSRTIGGTSPFTVAGWQQITRYDPQLIYGNQRRRRLGVGI
jgi:hypothetical protein